MAGTFIAEIIDDGMAYGKDLQGRLQSIANAATGGGTLPIGAVEWRAGGDPSLPAVTGIAAPLLPYLGQIPLIGEWVLIIEAPTADNNLFSAALGYYYLGPIQIDGEKNHNDLQGLTKRVTSLNPTIPKPLVPIFAKKNVPPVGKTHSHLQGRKQVDNKGVQTLMKIQSPVKQGINIVYRKDDYSTFLEMIKTVLMTFKLA